MDRWTRWIDQEALLRLSLLEVGQTCALICGRHHEAGRTARRLAEMSVVTLLLAGDLEVGQALSVVLRRGNRFWQADGTPEGLVRAFAGAGEDKTDSGHWQVVFRRFGISGLLYESFAEVEANEAVEALRQAVEQTDQLSGTFDVRILMDEDGRILSARGALLRGFPDTAATLLAAAGEDLVLRSWDEPWDLPSDLGGRGWDHVGELEPRFHCPCSHERARQSLLALGQVELESAAAEGEPLEVVCDACREVYRFDAVELLELAFENPSTPGWSEDSSAG